MTDAGPAPSFPTFPRGGGRPPTAAPSGGAPIRVGGFLPERAARPGGPRATGLTHVLDRLAPLSAESLRPLSPYVDIVKVGWGLPLLLGRETLRRRIAAFHRLGWQVSTGGTLLELAVVQGQVTRALRDVRTAGFDIVEVSEGVIDLSPAQVEELAGEVRRLDLDLLVEVGKKNPQNQYSLRETLERVGQARKLRPRKVILESRESGRGVGIYDPDGAIKWDWVHALIAAHPVEELLFEAPLESQQIGLLMDLGREVSLGNVAFDSVLPLASQRAGLRGDTFGLPRSHRPVDGSPAAKFVFYLLETHRSLDQGELVRLSRLPRRTVQSALEELKRQGRLTESVNFADARRREYRLA